MRNLGDSLRKLADQMITESGGTPDRPTSLYSAGTVGGQTPRRPPPVDRDGIETPASDTPPSDTPPPRQRDFAVEPMATDNVERRRQSVAQRRRFAAPQRAPIHALLRSPGSLRAAIVVSEVLGPPVSLRDERR